MLLSSKIQTNLHNVSSHGGWGLEEKHTHTHINIDRGRATRGGGRLPVVQVVTVEVNRRWRRLLCWLTEGVRGNEFKMESRGDGSNRSVNMTLTWHADAASGRAKPWHVCTETVVIGDALSTQYIIYVSVIAQLLSSVYQCIIHRREHFVCEEISKLINYFLTRTSYSLIYRTFNRYLQIASYGD